MFYQLKRLVGVELRLTSDMDAFRRTCAECNGVQNVIAPAVGLTPWELSAVIEQDETGQLRKAIDDAFSAVVGKIENRMLTLALGNEEVRPQSVTAMAMILNNRHPNYGLQRVQHGGSVSYAPTPHELSHPDEAPSPMRLIKPRGAANDA